MKISSPSYGFTLFEVLITMAILAIVASIVYGSLTAVTASTFEARAALEDTKLEQFVHRHIRSNLGQAVQGWLPGAADRLVPGEDEDVSAITFGFVGENVRGAAGAADTLEFVTHAPMPGAVVLPGSLKRVTYAVVEDGGEEDTPVIGPYDEDDPPAAYLSVSEGPMLGSASNDDRAIDGDAGGVSWKLPIRSMEIQYHDGEEWVEEWDADDEGRLPWAVDVRINFADTGDREDEDRFAFDSDWEEGPVSDADVHLIVTLPAGLGVTEAPPTYGSEDMPWRRGP